MSPRSVTSSVTVAVDPDTAFAMFTDEIACWWRQGPINFYDSTRAYGLRIEAGVGGRVLEVYDSSTGEGLELARVTAWEPGALVGWQSSLDDVATEVRFSRTSNGTLVEVRATIPDGGSDRGGTSWVRVVPAWLGRWASLRDEGARGPTVPARLAVAVSYRDPGAAARWLRDVAALEPASEVPEEGTGLDPAHTWIEFRAGTAAIVVLGTPDDASPAKGCVVPWVFVDDLDEHYGRVRASRATVLAEPHLHGARTYVVEDPEGVSWTFAQAGPRMRETG